MKNKAFILCFILFASCSHNSTYQRGYVISHSQVEGEVDPDLPEVVRETPVQEL